MAKQKKEDDQIPLSESQNLAITGRQDIRYNTVVLSGTAEEISNKLERALHEVKGQAAGEVDDNGRPYRITEALSKEGTCHYAYEITRGTGLGDTHKVKGSAFFEDDLATAFSKFAAHLAFIDDAFKFSGIEVTDIDSLHNHELSLLYTATGFKIKGDRDSEAIVLIGNKYLSLGGRMEIESPKIPLDNFSSYKWHNELKAAADAAREEVALYKEGKCHVPETEEEEKPDPKQQNLPFGSGDARDSVHDEFAEAAL